ncbi:hypothetical protein JW979_15575, partial [bacterium]|nr:hypothetical protein [candidate division CSSED10-310 bacterium]
IAKDLGLALSTVKEKIKHMTIRRILTITGKSRGGRAKWNTYELATWEELQFLDDWYNIRAKERKDNNRRSFDEQLPDGLINQEAAKQPLQEPPHGPSIVRQSAINNTNSIIQSNNTILASGDADIFESFIDEKDILISPKEKEFINEKKTVTAKHRVFNDRYKPCDVSHMLFPHATLKQIQDKTYHYFKNNDFAVYGHAPKLYELNEKDLPNLITGYSFLDYWNDYGYGDRSLSMYVLNLTNFVESIESERFRFKCLWEEDNAEYLVDDYILAHNVFDVRTDINHARIKRITDKHGDIETRNRLQTSWINCAPHNVSFCGGHLFATGDCIDDYIVKLITNEAVDKLLKQYEK